MPLHLLAYLNTLAYSGTSSWVVFVAEFVIQERMAVAPEGHRSLLLVLQGVVAVLVVHSQP